MKPRIGPNRRRSARTVAAVITGVLITSGCVDAQDAGSPSRGWRTAACALPHRWVERIDRGWRPTPANANDLVVVLDPASSHSGPQDYLQEVPLIFYGPRYISRRGPVTLPREVTLADVVPTYARLVGHQMQDLQGRALTEIIRPDAEPPKLIVTIVIDGGGWNALHTHPDAWPFIEELMTTGASVEDAIVGSSPSVTSSTHTTLATGVFPKQHGVTALRIRTDQGDIVAAFARELDHLGPEVVPGRNLKAPTFAESWDLASENEAEVAMLASFNYALGMIGRGAGLEGGDHDVLALGETGRWVTNDDLYRLPSYLRHPHADMDPEIAELDASDGEIDGSWDGYDMERLDATPAFSAWETRSIISMLERERFGQDAVTDLFFINYKAPDQAAHRWTVESEQERLAIASVDAGIRRVKQKLDEVYGNGYLILLTADHGQTELRPDLVTLNPEKVIRDVQAALSHEDDPRLIEKTASTTYFLSERALEVAGRSPEDVATFLSNYRFRDYTAGGRQDLKGAQIDPDGFVFEAVFPGIALPGLVECSRPT